MFKNLLLTTVIVFMLSACGGDNSTVLPSNTLPVSTPSAPSTPAPSTPAATTPTPSARSQELSRFVFLSSVNRQLAEDVQLQINSDTITGRSPTNVAVNELIATFTVANARVYVGDIEQESGVTANDFSMPVAYRIAGDDGSERDVTVDLTRFTGLPIIYANTQGNSEIVSKDEYIDGTIRVEGGRSFPSLEMMDMEIRGRGNSTWFGPPKKPYQMKLAEKEEFLGMPEDKKWLFLAEYSDKTMLRNRMAFELGYVSSLAWTPDSEFAEVFLNGQYNGTYLITQKVEEDGDRVDLGDDGFLLEIDQPERLSADDVFFTTDEYLINIKEPELTRGDSQYQYITHYVNEFEDVLFSANFADPTTGYAAYINIDSFIDWFLISEITKNVDSQWWSSIYFHVLPGQKINMGPLWDFDLSFGNVDYADSQYAEGWWVQQNTWINRLLDDPVFAERVKTRFRFFRDQEAQFIAKIDAYADYLKYAQAANDQKWQTLGEYVWPNPVVFDTHAEEVAHLKSWFIQRMNWLNNAIPTL